MKIIFNNLKKKAQASGAQAAALVGIILVLMIVYILLLPQGDREELLGESSSSGGGEISSEEAEDIVLLSENIGRVDYQKENEYELTIPSFKIFQTKNAKELKKFNPFIIQNGWFNKRTKTLSFNIDDLEIVDNVILSFNAKTRKGVLTIKLNDEVIFEDRVSSFNVGPIYLPKDLLKKENKLEFSVSGVGLAFWRTNEYNLENVRITADVTDISRQETRNSFFVEDWKYNNLEKVSLKFTPHCKQDEVGILNIEINRKNVFSGVPDCDMLNKIDIAPYVLNAGMNSIVFKTERGSYLVDLVKIILKLRKMSYPLYYFELNETEFSAVENGSKDVILSIEFVDDGEYKTLDLVVNGHKRRIDQKQASYERNINEWVEEGNNYVEIIPKTTLNIVNLEIKLKEKD